jgi:hypothetical protein
MQSTHGIKGPTAAQEEARRQSDTDTLAER